MLLLHKIGHLAPDGGECIHLALDLLGAVVVFGVYRGLLRPLEGLQLLRCDVVDLVPDLEGRRPQRGGRRPAAAVPQGARTVALKVSLDGLEREGLPHEREGDEAHLVLLVQSIRVVLVDHQADHQSSRVYVHALQLARLVPAALI